MDRIPFTAERVPDGPAFFAQEDYGQRAGETWPPPPGTPYIRYRRASAANKNEPGHGLDDQLEQLEAIERQYGLVCVADEAEVFRSVYTERPKLARVLDHLEAGLARHVMVAAFDRFIRPEYIEDAHILNRAIRLRNGVLMAPGVVYDGEMGELRMTFDAKSAGDERRRIAGRFQRRRDIRVVRDQRPAGTGPAGYGYAWTTLDGVDLKRSAYKLDDEPAADGDEPRLKHERARHILDWLADGWTAGDVRLELHRRGWRSPTGQEWWTVNRICYMARNPLYCGKPQARRFRTRRVNVGKAKLKAIRRETPPEMRVELKAGTAPAIVSEATLAAAAATLERNKKAVRRRSSGDTRWLLADGLAICGHCGGVLTPNSSSRANPGRYDAYYFCSKAKRTRKAECVGVGAVPASVIDEAAWEEVVTASRERERIIAWAINSADADLPEAREAELVEAELARSVTARDRLVRTISKLDDDEAAVLEPDLAEVKATIDRLKERRARLRAAIEGRDARLAGVRRVVGDLERLEMALEQMPREKRVATFAALGLRVEVRDWKAEDWTIELGHPPARPSRTIGQFDASQVRSEEQSDQPRRLRIPLPIPA